MAAGGDDFGTTRLAADRATRTLTETPWSTLTVAVTGANGYFGHRLVKSLVEAKVAQVVALDRVHTRSWPRDRVRTVTADVRDPDAVRAALTGVEAVVHVASYFGNPPFSTVSDSGEWAVNAEGTRNLLAAAAAQGVHSFVYISSSSAIVSGRQELLDVPETHPYPTRYLDFYGPAKAAAERFVLAAHGQPAERPLHTAVIRPSGIFGEDELLHIPRVLALVDRMGGYLPVYFAGDPRSDWTHTENLAWAVYLVLDQLRRPHGGRAGGEIFHITDGESLSTSGSPPRGQECQDVILSNICAVAVRALGLWQRTLPSSNRLSRRVGGASYRWCRCTCGCS